MNAVVVVGCGGHGRVIADSLRVRGDQFAGFLDDRHVGESITGSPVLGKIDLLRDQEFLLRYAIIIGLGDTRLRRKLSEEVLARGGRLATAIHPSAVVASDVVIGEGTVLMAGTVINTGTKVGKFVVVNTCATIDHDNSIEDGVHISPGCNLAGWVTCGKDAFIGTGASLIPRVKVGAHSLVAAGATVIRDVLPRTLVAGTPATLKRELELGDTD